MDDADRANIIEGWAVLTRALGTVLTRGAADSDTGIVIREGFDKLRALQKFSLTQLASLD